MLYAWRVEEISSAFELSVDIIELISVSFAKYYLISYQPIAYILAIETKNAGFHV